METTLDQPLANPSRVRDDAPTSRTRWAGRVLSAVPVLFLAFDAIIKLLHHPAVAEGSARLGLPVHVNGALGAILLACVCLFVVPRTAVLGAVLLTGYLGGAVAMHVRVEDPLMSHTLFPVYVGVLLWTGLFLRDARVRALGRTLAR